MSTRVLIAFDKFKDALSAARASAIAARELRRAHPDWVIESVPITDGGDGFCRILTEAASGEMVAVPASGPRLEPRTVPVGFVDWARLPRAARQFLANTAAPTGRVAVIEMAAVNGLALVPRHERDPWQTTSYGTGQLVRAAAELGAGAIVLGVGGSATSDLGLGALNALGLEFRGADHGKIRPPFPHTWTRVAQIEGAVFGSIPPIAIACDVTNPLLGPTGAAAVYGPQKGLSSADQPRLEAEAERLARLLCGHCANGSESSIHVPGAGAAGGIAFGLMTAARARLVAGFEFVAAWLELDAKIAAADLVITGEGRFDASSLSGKGPGAIAQRARAAGRRVHVFVGARDKDVNVAGDIAVHVITPEGEPLADALAHADRHLAQAVAQTFAGGSA